MQKGMVTECSNKGIVSCNTLYLQAYREASLKKSCTFASVRKINKNSW